jgi:hypothetical protein
MPHVAFTGGESSIKTIGIHIGVFGCIERKGVRLQPAIIATRQTNCYKKQGKYQNNIIIQ